MLAGQLHRQVASAERMAMGAWPTAVSRDVVNLWLALLDVFGSNVHVIRVCKSKLCKYLRAHGPKSSSTDGKTFSKCSSVTVSAPSSSATAVARCRASSTKARTSTDVSVSEGELAASFVSWDANPSLRISHSELSLMGICCAAAAGASITSMACDAKGQHDADRRLSLTK